MSEWKEVIGSQSERPAEIDVTSSAFVVYERKDIQRYEEKDDEENVIYKGWKYKERQVPKEQWSIETAASNKKNLDAIMLGLTDLYEVGIGGI